MHFHLPIIHAIILCIINALFMNIETFEFTRRTEQSSADLLQLKSFFFFFFLFHLLKVELEKFYYAVCNTLGDAGCQLFFLTLSFTYEWMTTLPSLYRFRYTLINLIIPNRLIILFFWYLWQKIFFITISESNEILHAMSELTNLNNFYIVMILIQINRNTLVPTVHQ